MEGLYGTGKGVSSRGEAGEHEAQGRRRERATRRMEMDIPHTPMLNLRALVAFRPSVVEAYHEVFAVCVSVCLVCWRSSTSSRTSRCNVPTC
jgi:hypothetical protein